MCRGVVTIRRQAGVSRSVTSFFFFPAAVCKELRFELNHTEEGKYGERKEFRMERKRGGIVLTSQLFYSTLAQLNLLLLLFNLDAYSLKHNFGNLWYFSYR